MLSNEYFLALDIGTTSVKALLVDQNGVPLGQESVG